MPSLFDPDLPEGFVYRPDFISPDEEALLIDAIRQVEFSNFEMRGVVARRRVAFFGSSYDAGRTRTLPLPAFLRPLRERAAALAGVDAEAFAMALINEYSPGAPIGWHRDAPGFGVVVGVSLLSGCRFRFRRGPERGSERVSLTLEPRSAYVLSGPARSEWQHSIPEVETLRYSVTFRTLKR